MKKRLRKKLHLREFKEMGFLVRFRITSEADDDRLTTLLDDFLEMIESAGMGFGGGGNHEWEGFVTRMERGSVTEEQRLQVDRWLGECSEITEHEVGPLEDAWHG